MDVIFKNTAIVFFSLFFLSCSVESTMNLDKNNIKGDKVSNVTISSSSEVGVEIIE